MKKDGLRRPPNAVPRGNYASHRQAPRAFLEVKKCKPTRRSFQRGRLDDLLHFGNDLGILLSNIMLFADVSGEVV